MGVLRPFLKLYHRCEVRGLENFPAGGALVVANHSGGLFPMDVPVFALGFYDAFGYDRPVYTLSHDMLMTGPTAGFLIRNGFIRANRENADEALRSGGVVVVFPGGDYDVYRPTFAENKIDFDGRTGYVKAALNAGVPIVPTVAIGGQENQIYLSRGTGLAKLLRLDKLMRAKILPISFGFPFGLSAPCCRSTSRCRPRSSCRYSSRSTSARSSATTPTSTTSTPTCAVVMQRGTRRAGRRTSSSGDRLMAVLLAG